MGLWSWWKSRRLERRVRKGKQAWGRQPEARGEMSATTKARGTMSARVYRAATDTWEDLGVIGEGEVDRKTYDCLVDEARKKEE
jgi:hypothetical protein